VDQALLIGESQEDHDNKSLCCLGMVLEGHFISDGLGSRYWKCCHDLPVTHLLAESDPHMDKMSLEDHTKKSVTFV